MALGDVRITVSIGTVTVYESLGTTHQAPIDAADKNLYGAKRKGRNRMVGTILTPRPRGDGFEGPR